MRYAANDGGRGPPPSEGLEGPKCSSVEKEISEGSASFIPGVENMHCSSSIRRASSVTAPAGDFDARSGLGSVRTPLMAERHPGFAPITLVLTVHNCASELPDLLTSVGRLRLLPSEVSVTDLGSTDGTVELLRAWAAPCGVPVRVISAPGASTSVGRNLAIEAASFEHIAVTHGAVCLHPEWLARMWDALSEGNDVVAGKIEPVGSTLLQRTIGRVRLRRPTRWNRRRCCRRAVPSPSPNRNGTPSADIRNGFAMARTKPSAGPCALPAPLFVSSRERCRRGIRGSPWPVICPPASGCPVRRPRPGSSAPAWPPGSRPTSDWPRSWPAPVRRCCGSPPPPPGSCTPVPICAGSGGPGRATPTGCPGECWPPWRSSSAPTRGGSPATRLAC